MKSKNKIYSASMGYKYMETGSLIHVLSGLITGIIFLLIGIIIIKKNPKYALHKSLLAFFVFIGGYQIVDAAILFIGENPSVLTIFRSFVKMFILLGGIFIVIGTQIIQTGEKNALSKNNIIKYLIYIIITTFLAVIGENQIVFHNHHLELERNVFGWIGLLGSLFIDFLVVFIILTQVIRLAEESSMRKKIISLLISLTVIFIVLFLFELSYSIESILHLIENNIFHIIVHLLLISAASTILYNFSKKN